MTELKHEYKIELVVSNGMLNRIIELLEEAGIYEFTVLEIARGRGNKDGDTQESRITVTNNMYLFSVCTEEQKNEAIRIIQPVFEVIGGLFVVSEVFCLDP